MRYGDARVVSVGLRCGLVTLVNEDIGEVSVPEWVRDWRAFRRWSESAEFPEHGRIWWLCGGVWVDTSKEQIFTHVQLKTEFTVVVGGLARQKQTGLYLTDGVYLSNEPADISGNPDGVYVSFNSLEAQRVRLVEGARGGYSELEGSPDMVLEIVSEGSVEKDTVILRAAYGDAGIREYWLVDARKEPLRFDILRHTARGFVATRKQDGWLRSAVFDKSFRLRRGLSPAGLPKFTLEVR